MKISKVRYSMGTTINLGDYENLKTNIEIEVEVDESDDIDTVIEELKTLTRNKIAADYQKYKRK